MLNIDKLFVSFQQPFGKLTVVKDLSVNVEKHDFISIIGCNGTGKSSLFKSIYGGVPFEKGRIELLGKSLFKEPIHDRLKKIAVVHQNIELGSFGDMTLRENLSLVLSKTNGKPWRKCLNYKSKELLKSLELLPIDLKQHIDSPAKCLSGGQRQAFNLLLAILSKPDLLLLDEHTAALDPKSSDLIMEMTEDLVKKFQITTMMITHHLGHAIKYGNRLIVLRNGNIHKEYIKTQKSNLLESDLIKYFY